MIRIENLTKSYGDRVIFEDISFSLNARERLGLVGRNGHGKTTLLRLISGEEPPDCGSINIPKNYRIGYVQQDLNFTADTALMEGITALPVQAPDHYWKVEKVLAGLGFSPEDFHRPPREFSGGFQVRLNLAKAIIAEPDLLLLDEPTNFLDITSIRWIERFLCNWPHELVLITHDRGFMDKVVTHTMGIHRRKVRKITGNTAKYYNQIARDEEIYEKTRINDDRRRKDIEQFITRFRAKARLANLVQSRIKTLQKMEKKDKLEKLKTLEFSFRSIPMPGNHVLSARHLTFAYDRESALIRDFNITISPGERVCVVGKNGKGKTTLLKLLAGELKPQGGDIAYHPTVNLGFFEQTNTQSLVDTHTVEEEILFSYTDVDRQLARNICGAMLFTGEEALKKVSVLSGGEKSRVMLGKLLVTPLNLLMLDEPSNHLDMESCDALLAAIDSFEGTVILVTHNEMFLHTLADRLIVFQNDSIEQFTGSYQEFLERGGWQDEFSTAESERAPTLAKARAAKQPKKEIRRRRSEIISRRSKVVKPIEERITRLENDILVRETELHQLNDLIQKASRDQDGLRIADLARAIHACRSSIDQLFVELEHTTKELEVQNETFEQQLQELEPDYPK